MGTGRLSIDLDAIAANYRALAAASADRVATAAVVKADAYGLGVTEVAPRLARAGASEFFVATAEEGERLWPWLPVDCTINIFSGHMQGDAARIARAGLVPMLNSPAQVKRHLSEMPEHPFGVQLDTGMNRLGMEPADWQAVRDTVLARNPVLLMSHLACADEPDHAMNARQLANFRDMTDGTGCRRSLSATGGILLGPEYHFDLTRPGVGLYGGMPFADAQPVAHLSLPVIQVRDVRAGESVGYGNSWHAESNRRVATVAGGYADGILRALSSGCSLYAGSTACPLVGRVSMDLLTIDVTEADGAPDALDLICAHQTIDDLADRAGTIGYEILTSLGARYERTYGSAA